MPILVLCVSCQVTMRFTWQKGINLCPACIARLEAANADSSEPVFGVPRQQYEIEEEP